MKRGSQLTLKIDGIKFPSTGISECEGKKVYVKGAFPGQTVKATVKKNREGYANGGWILLDYYDIIVHIFSEEERSFYDLEHIWRDGNIVSMGDL